MGTLHTLHPNTTPLEVEVAASARASLRLLWECLVLPVHLQNWWAGVSLEPRPFGRFEEHWSANGLTIVTRGVVSVAEPERRLVMSWAEAAWGFDTEVAILFAERAGKGEVTVVHSGWENAPESRREVLMDEHRTGWQYHLDDLMNYAASIAASGRVRA